MNKAITKRTLLRALQAALAGSMLASTMAGAVLRDHGPENATNHFPSWYRDHTGTAMGQCITDDYYKGAKLCLWAGADTTRFPGNLGPEAFYSTNDIIIGPVHWMGHLEITYATAGGMPPVVWNAADRQETVFSRERILIDVPVTGTGACAGHYTVRTPFKVHEFNLQEGRRALSYTDDILPIPADFAAVLKGHSGPFFVWDNGDGITPIDATTTPIVVTPPVGAPRKYAGDPNLLHTFVGSTLPAGPGHEDKVFNNYLEVTPPATCNLGTLNPGEPLFEDRGSISGLFWDQPIADPVTITRAAYTRNTSAAGLDVWASAAKNQNLVLTAVDSNSPQLPSITLQEETKNGVHTGVYHAHIEFNSADSIPAQVTVTNLTSIPQSRNTAAVADAIVVTKSVYDPSTRKLCVVAHSGDETNPNELSLESPAYGPFTAPTETCPGLAANDRVLEKDLNSFAPDMRFPPEGVLIQSSRGGKESSHPVSPATGFSSEAPTATSTAVADHFTLDGTGTTPLDLLADNGNGVDSVTNGTIPRIVIVSQPDAGTVTAPTTGGTVTYQAQEGMASGEQSFYYAIQDTVSANSPVSNVAKVTLDVKQVIPPPVSVGDAQGVFRTSTGATIRVLDNDVTGASTTPIDVTSVKLIAPAGWTLSPDEKVLTGSRGTITAQADGTLRYVPLGQGSTVNNAVFSFQYTVANTSGNGLRSAPTTVKIMLKASTEAISFTRVRPTWDIRFTDSYAGVFVGATTGTNAGEAGNLTLAPVATCKLYTNSTAYNNGAGTPIGTIGSALPGAGTNAYTLAGTSPAVPAGSTSWVVGCTNNYGSRASRTGQL